MSFDWLVLFFTAVVFIFKETKNVLLAVAALLSPTAVLLIAVLE
jgi:hypothetical protein